MVLVADHTDASQFLANARQELRFTLSDMAEAISRAIGRTVPTSQYKNFEYGKVKKIPPEVIRAAERLKSTATPVQSR